MNVPANIDKEFSEIRYDLLLEQWYMINTECNISSSYSRNERMIDLFLLSHLMESSYCNCDLKK